MVSRINPCLESHCNDFTEQKLIIALLRSQKRFSHSNLRNSREQKPYIKRLRVLGSTVLRKQISRRRQSSSGLLPDEPGQRLVSRPMDLRLRMSG
ncbi:hypothetical protein CEXT_288771 [Caerostris extrusa]|uniref:Uncharacterized protein n=1 Tax=Caerostris extrusa TaxID=172846 RepID=A0AAV4RQS6_CAEEX|nr:hypothetical protein CEXT_288771 [Caerostris extrusa]